MAKSPSAVHGELLWSLSTYQPLHLKRVLKNELKHSVLTKFRVLLVNLGSWHSCGCHLKVADQVHPPMATALPSCSGPHSKTTRPAFTVKTARELPKNVIESSRHRRGPPNSPDLNQIEHCAKPDPWRTICGLDSDLSRHGHGTSEGVPGQQWSFESRWSPPTHTPVHKCVTVFLLMATIGRGQ